MAGKRMCRITLVVLAGIISVFGTIRCQERERRVEHADEPGGASGQVAGEQHATERLVHLTAAEIEEAMLEVAQAEPGRIDRVIELPGEVVINADRLVHLVPRVTGIVRQVYKELGDEVRTGEVMAVIESRELADAKAEYLAAGERLILAQAIFEREAGLWQKKISSEQEYLNAKQVLTEARITLRSAQQKLLALGFSQDYLAEIRTHENTDYTRYEIVAPFNGTVIKKHMALGEALKEDTEVFVVADLSAVWIDISVYQQDLALVSEGQRVVLIADPGSPVREGAIEYVGPILGERTRAAIARTTLPNRDGDLRPGMFVTARISVDSVEVSIAVEKEAVQVIDGEKAVFVSTDEGFEVRHVNTGVSNGNKIEIVAGLEQGERYVWTGAFNLKAKLITGSLDSHAGHGH
jgi:cobalt-zinc-cadmium efflux system membrane fusion protein